MGRLSLEVNLGSIQANFRSLVAYASPCDVMVVLKANAYGLGVREIAQCLIHESKCWGIGVANITEAKEVFDLGKPVLILGAILPDELIEVIELGVRIPIADLKIAGQAAEVAKQLNKKVFAHCLIDTGMGRLGCRLEDAQTFITELDKMPEISLEGLFSHFPYAYGDYDFSYNQVVGLKNLIRDLQDEGIHFKYQHIANSDGIHNIPGSLQKPFNLVRSGINLYGQYDPEGQRSFELQQVLTLRAKLVAVRELPQGASVGYGRQTKLKSKTRIGTIAIGYADGLPIGLSNKGHFIIRGKKCPILGRISMDYTTVDLSACVDAEVGDQVLCLTDDYNIQNWAEESGTISYDIICSLGKRVERSYIL
ncbi:MAG: alanine racemase [Lentisphaeria bacterium]|nr:alanine racemase [Lentisphaeria bacterium]